MALINVIRRARLDVAHEVGEHYAGVQTKENVRVIRHTIDCEELLTLPGNDARHVLLQGLFALRSNQVLPRLHREHDLDVDLRIGICHFRNGDSI